MVCFTVPRLRLIGQTKMSRIFINFIEGALIHSGMLWESGETVIELLQKSYQFTFVCDFMGWGFPGGTSGKESACQCRRHKRCGFDPWVGTIP